MNLQLKQILFTVFLIIVTASSCIKNPADKEQENLIVFAGLLRAVAAQTTATRVYGQFGNFSVNTANLGGISAGSLSNPYKTAIDSSGGLYVADRLNNRVLYYPAGFTTATKVYGQFGNFSCGIANNNGTCAAGSPSVYNLSSPADVTVDAFGGLYVADSGNNRVLYYPAGFATPTRVYGQFGNLSCGVTNNNGACTSGTSSSFNLNGPSGIALDSTGGLYVADFFNNRILYYPAGFTAATRVYGQFGNFGCRFANNNGTCAAGTPSAFNLKSPQGIAVDSSDGLYIADGGNQRVLYYPKDITIPAKVYGQFGNFTTGIANPGGISANSLSGPSGVTVDISGGLYVADWGNNRVLYYPAGFTSATTVYGQFGNFSCGIANNNGTCFASLTSGNSLSSPTGVTVDPFGGLYISESIGNNRVLYFPPGI